MKQLKTEKPKEELEFESIIVNQGVRKSITVPQKIHRELAKTNLQGKKVLVIVKEI